MHRWTALFLAARTWPGCAPGEPPAPPVSDTARPPITVDPRPPAAQPASQGPDRPPPPPLPLLHLVHDLGVSVARAPLDSLGLAPLDNAGAGLESEWWRSMYLGFLPLNAPGDPTRVLAAGLVHAGCDGTPILDADLATVGCFPARVGPAALPFASVDPAEGWLAATGLIPLDLASGPHLHLYRRTEDGGWRHVQAHDGSRWSAATLVQGMDEVDLIVLEAVWPTGPSRLRAARLADDGALTWLELPTAPMRPAFEAPYVLGTHHSASPAADGSRALTVVVLGGGSAPSADLVPEWTTLRFPAGNGPITATVDDLQSLLGPAPDFRFDARPQPRATFSAAAPMGLLTFQQPTDLGPRDFADGFVEFPARSAPAGTWLYVATAGTLGATVALEEVDGALRVTREGTLLHALHDQIPLEDQPRLVGVDRFVRKWGSLGATVLARQDGGWRVFDAMWTAGGNDGTTARQGLVPTEVMGLSLWTAAFADGSYRGLRPFPTATGTDPTTHTAVRTGQFYATGELGLPVEAGFSTDLSWPDPRNLLPVHGAPWVGVGTASHVAGTHDAAPGLLTWQVDPAADRACRVYTVLPAGPALSIEVDASLPDGAVLALRLATAFSGAGTGLTVAGPTPRVAVTCDGATLPPQAEHDVVQVAPRAIP